MNQPLFPASCMRRAAQEIYGSKRPTTTRFPMKSVPAKPSAIPARKVDRYIKKTKLQNSFLVARPLKSTYLLSDPINELNMILLSCEFEWVD